MDVERLLDDMPEKGDTISLVVDISVVDIFPIEESDHGHAVMTGNIVMAHGFKQA